MLFLKGFILLSLLALSLGEVVDFKPCPGADSCTIHEARISPCPQATQHAACHVRRRKATQMSYDFTPNFDAETLEAGLSWAKSETEELPLITMDTDACKYTTCPVKAGQKHTYTIDVPIESKFPTSSYTIKWRLKSPSGEICCFTNDIKVIR